MSRRLAVLGGSPRFSDLLHVGKPNVGDRSRFLSRVEEMLDRRWLTNHGPLVREFEERVCEIVGVRNAVSVCNATAGLELVMRALDIKGPVVMPAYTFVATAHAAKWIGLEPKFCDVDPETHCVTRATANMAVDGAIGALIGVHIWGRVCDVGGLAKLAEDLGVPLLFDAAHAFGCSNEGTMVGSFGVAEVFSFHATKFVNTFEGGVVTTNDDELAHRLLLMSRFGFDGIDNVEMLGINAKMSEVSAAMGLTTLEAMDEICAQNRANFETYQSGLSSIPGLRVLQAPRAGNWNYQYVVIEVDQSKFGMCRDCLAMVLTAENVMARRYFYPGCHRSPPYCSRSSKPQLPVTDRLVSEALVLPTGTAITEDVVLEICGIVEQAAAMSREIESRLHAAV